MKIEISLSQKSVNHAIGQLKRYKEDLKTKNEIFLSRLIDAGISVAEKNVGKYTGYVSFEKKVSSRGNVGIGILKGKDTKPFISWWYYKGGRKEVKVSGIYMSEFGSGWLSEVLFDVGGVGQGTFPDQKHAFEPVWHWTDDQGYHTSSGENPTHPMYRAMIEMYSQMYMIAREVFYSG